MSCALSGWGILMGKGVSLSLATCVVSLEPTLQEEKKPIPAGTYVHIHTHKNPYL